VVEFEGQLHLLTTEAGGRETSLVSGWRPIVRFGAAESEPAWGVEITFDVPAALAPGESAAVQLRSWAWPETDPAPQPGTRMFFYEGARMVGTGTVR
jgi:translation elongation factor EF-Tu-like GTPase